MTDNDVFTPELATRASSPALSAILELSVLSRSPSSVPNYQTVPQIMAALPLTPPSTPLGSRAANGRFAPRSTKRASTPGSFSPSKKLRSSKDPSSPGSSPSPRSPRAPSTPHKFFEDTVPSLSKPVIPTATPWVAGLGGCGTLEVIPKELRQKIYSFAFDLDEPVTMKICCGPETTVRERGACKKHGAGAASGGRFNILGISKMMRTEAIWVLMTQGKLVLDVNGALEKYLRYYRWSSQRRSAPASPDDDRKVAMWKAASQFRDVKLKIPYPILSYGDPGVYMNDLVEAAFSLCQSWTQEQCVDVRPQRTVTVDLGHLFGTESPFNLSYPDHMDSALDWLGCHYADIRQPDFARIGPDASNNLRRLLSVVSRHRGQSKWTFAAHAELYDYEAFAEGAEWLEAFQAACAGFDLPFENCSPRPYHMPWKTT